MKTFTFVMQKCTSMFIYLDLRFHTPTFGEKKQQTVICHHAPAKKKLLSYQKKTLDHVRLQQTKSSHGPLREIFLIRAQQYVFDSSYRGIYFLLTY